MIIDADVHITPYPEGIGASELLDKMDKAGIDKALTWLQPPYEKNLDSYLECNQYVANAMKNNPDRILGFGWVDPHVGMNKSKHLLKRCVEDYEFYGIKLNGAQNDFFIDAPDISLPLVEQVSKYGKVLAFHVGSDAYDKTHPFRVGKIADKFPDLTILVVHMGGVGTPEVSKAAIEIALEHDNVYLIGSEVSSKSVINAVQKLGDSRVCFGSDAPFELMSVELARYNAILDEIEGITEEGKNKILGDNIYRILSLKS